MTLCTQYIRRHMRALSCILVGLASTTFVVGQVGGSSSAAMDFETLKSRYELIYDASQHEVDQAKNALRVQYGEFLSKLEQRLQASGDLERLLKVRQEKAAVTENGSTTSSEDPELEKARETFRNRLQFMDQEKEAKLTQVRAAYSNRLQTLEVKLTKEGNIPEAIAVKKEREALATSAAPPPTLNAGAERPAIPEIQAPVVGKDFLKTKGIEQSFTLPAGKYKLSEPVEVKRPENMNEAANVLFSNGTELTGDKGGQFFLGAGTLVGKEIRAQDLKWSGDLKSHFYFAQSTFKNCSFSKGGAWVGAKHAVRWHFEDCNLEGAFMPEIKVKKIGLRMFGCQVKGVSFPSLDFEGFSVTEFASSEWFQVQDSIFEKCEIPLSFLLITKGCKFVNCTFVDDTRVPVVDAPLQITFEELECTWKSKGEMENVQFTKLSAKR